jgi:murein L,D-transpeptidase YcbB/YkuD
MKRRTKKALERLEAEAQELTARTIEKFEQKNIAEISAMTRNRIEANGSSLEREPTKAEMAWTYFRELHLEALTPLEEYAILLLNATLPKGKYGIFNITEILNPFTYAKHTQISTSGENYKNLKEKFDLSRQDEIELYSECFDRANLATILEELATMKQNEELPDTPTLVGVLLKKLAEFYAAKHIETQFNRRYPLVTSQ